MIADDDVVWTADNCRNHGEDVLKKCLAGAGRSIQLLHHYKSSQWDEQRFIDHRARVMRFGFEIHSWIQQCQEHKVWNEEEAWNEWWKLVADEQMITDASHVVLHRLVVNGLAIYRILVERETLTENVQARLEEVRAAATPTVPIKTERD